MDDSSLQWLRKIVGPFHSEKQVKALVAGCYIQDGDDHLAIFNCAEPSGRKNLSFKSKLYINLRMALECYLKSLIVSHSKDTETPEEAYRAVRKLSHRISSLDEAARERSDARRSKLCLDNLSLLQAIDKLDVDLRYHVDVVAALTDEEAIERATYSGAFTGTVGSENWLLAVRSMVVGIGDAAKQDFQSKLGRHRAFLGSDAEARERRFKEFFEAAGVR